MKDLRAAAQLLYAPELLEDGDAPAARLTALFGHYRLDRFNQAILEDLRQRLSRRGVSLLDFRGAYLPVVRGILEEGVRLGWLERAPVLFDYDLPAVQLADWWELWLAYYEDEASGSTIQRYSRLLERELLPRFRDLDLRELDGGMIERFRKEYLAAGGGETGFKFLPRILLLILDFAVARAVAQSPDNWKMDIRTDGHIWLKDVAPGWLDTLEGGEREAARRELEETILPLIGLTDLRRLGERKLYDYKRMLARQGKGSKVFQTHARILSRIRAYAAGQGLVEAEKRLRRPKTGAPPRPLTDRERRALESGGGEDPDRMILWLAAGLGLKNEELRALRWDDLDLEKGLARAPGREIPIPAELVEPLRALARENGPHGCVLLSAQKKCSPVSMPYLIRAAKEALKRRGLGELSLDDLRDDYAIRQLAVLPPQEAARRCGYPDTARFLGRFADQVKKK